MIFEKLSQEQKNVTNYLIKGYSNLEIAEEIGYSERTINRKLQEICKIYNVNNSKQLIIKLISDKFSLPLNL